MQVPPVETGQIYPRGRRSGGGIWYELGHQLTVDRAYTEQLPIVIPWSWARVPLNTS